MKHHFILASGSEIRAKLLRAAGLKIETKPTEIDEVKIQSTMLANGAPPGKIALELAHTKARKIAKHKPKALILGCDQVAALGKRNLTKPTSKEDAKNQLNALSGTVHSLYSAAVLYYGTEPVWHHIGRVNMHMHPLTHAYIEAYIARNWHSIRHAVGCYKLEEEGVRLFSAVEGDYFHVLGLPLIELLSYLTDRGELER